MYAIFRRYRTHVAALVVAAAVGSSTWAFGLFDDQLAIVAPDEVVAGNPIQGYVTGMEGPGSITPSYSGPGATPPTPTPGAPCGSGGSIGGILGGATAPLNSALNAILPLFNSQGGSLEGDPAYFTIMTFEPMAPGVVTIKAKDADESATESVFVK